MDPSFIHELGLDEQDAALERAWNSHPEGFLDAHHRAALEVAADSPFVLAEAFPPAFSEHYDSTFAAHAGTAAAALRDRLATTIWVKPASVAEQMLLWRIIAHAELVLAAARLSGTLDRLVAGASATPEPAEDGVLSGWGSFNDYRELAFDNHDFLLLWAHPTANGQEIATQLGFVNLALHDWFKPFPEQERPAA
jgi:hypothetical protein